MHFTKDQILAAGADWELASTCNDAMNELRAQRVQILSVTGDLMRSKIAWKYAVLRQAITHRLVDLGDAAIAQCEQGNALSGIVLGRAFFETVALLYSLVRGVEKSLGTGDVESLDQFVMRVSFGGRHPDWRLSDLEAVNVLTALDHMGREFPNARDLYERVSEIAHPNSQGTHQFYARTDYELGDVTFSREKRQASAVHFPLIFASTLGLRKLQEIDGMLKRIADLQDPC